MEKASLHTAAAVQPRRGGPGDERTRGAAAAGAAEGIGVAASLTAPSRSPTDETVGSPELFRFCNQMSGAGSWNPRVTHPNSSAKSPPSPQRQKTPSTGIRCIKILIAAQTLLPKFARPGLCLLILSKLSLMLRHTGLVINDVWRDVLRGHHGPLYPLPLASCQFIPSLFSELVFIDSFPFHSPSHTK